jgi:hypothetical protein
MTWIFVGWMLARLFVMDPFGGPAVDGWVLDGAGGQPPQTLDGGGGQPPEKLDGAGGQPPEKLDGAGGQPPSRL